MIFRRKKNASYRSASSSFRFQKLGMPRLRRRLKPLRKRTIGQTRIKIPRKTDRRNPPLKKIGFFLIVGILVGVTANTVVFSDSLNINTIEVIEDEQLFKNHPIGLLLERYKGENLLFLRTDPLEEDLLKQYPIYETLEIKKNFPQGLIVNVKKYIPIANLMIEEQNFALNTAGRIMEGDPDENLPNLKIERETALPVGTQVISKQHMAFGLEAIQAFEDKFGMNVLHGLYLETEREFHLWTERKFYVWLDLSASLDLQLNKLKQALPKLNIYEENLEYIDLRISGINGEKVIFKRKG